MRKLLPLFLVVLLANNLFAFDEPGLIEFDLFKKDKNLSVGLDLSGIISTQRVEKLREGVEYIFDLKFDLTSPRKIWGTEIVSEKNYYFKIGFRIVTRDFYFMFPQEDNENSKRTFSSLRRLHQYLSDSLYLDIAVLDSLKKDKDYVLDIELNCIAMTSLNLSPTDTSGVTTSPVKYLFKGFLSLTGYGREKYREKSRPFSLNELNKH